MMLQRRERGSANANALHLWRAASPRTLIQDWTATDVTLVTLSDADVAEMRYEAVRGALRNRVTGDQTTNGAP